MKNIINKHWTRGGTGMTNFNKSERPRYEAAIKASGHPYLIISDLPMMDNISDNSTREWMEENMNGLHDVGLSCNLSEFWKILDQTNI